jgi:putative heme transporter
MRHGRPDRRLTGAAVAIVAAAALYLALPAIAGLDETWRLLKSGSAWWLALGLVLELGSYAGYVLLFQRVFRNVDGIGFRRSIEITLAGVAATRLLATAGAGGVALTAWALRRSGLGRAAVARGMTTFLVALYSVYMTALVVFGLGLSSGLLPGPAPFGLTVVPALFGAVVIAVALSAAAVPGDLPTRVDGARRAVQLGSRALAAVARGVRGALRLLAARDVGYAGALAWWAFDIAVLWACFHAFGGAPPLAVLVLVYFVGMLANTLPLPGGVGGVDGGMIAAAIGFGIDEGLAIVAVLAYRAIAFWLPTVPGALAYAQLRRELEREDEQQAGAGLAPLARAERDHVEVGDDALRRVARRPCDEQMRDAGGLERGHRLVGGRARSDVGR